MGKQWKQCQTLFFGLQTVETLFFGLQTVETMSDFIFWAPKSLQMVIAAIKLKDTYSLEGKL